MKKLIFAALLAASAYAATITDILERKVEVKDDPSKVILTFYFEEYFSALGERGVDIITAWSQKYWLGRRQASWDAFTTAFPKLEQVPDIGYGPKKTLSFEKMIALKPDLIIFPRIVYEQVKPNLDMLAAAKIPAVFIDFHDENLDTHMRSMSILGEIFGEQKRIAEINAFYKEKFELVQNRLAKAKAEGKLNRPKVYLEFSEKAGAEQFGGTWDDKMWGAMATLAGGQNIASGKIKGTSAVLNPELIIASNPDVIIFAGNYFLNSFKNIPMGYGITEEQARANIAQYTARQGWANLNAVKNGRMYALYHDLSRHIFDFAGMLFFAKAIHPELFADIDPKAELNEFFRRFYPIQMDGTWMVKF